MRIVYHVNVKEFPVLLGTQLSHVYTAEGKKSAMFSYYDLSHLAADRLSLRALDPDYTETECGK